MHDRSFSLYSGCIRRTHFLSYCLTTVKVGALRMIQYYFSNPGLYFTHITLNQGWIWKILEAERNILIPKLFSFQVLKGHLELGINAEQQATNDHIECLWCSNMAKSNKPFLTLNFQNKSRGERKYHFPIEVRISFPLFPSLWLRVTSCTPLNLQ